MSSKDMSTPLKDSEKTNYETGRKAPWIICTSPVMWDASHLSVGWQWTDE